LAVAVGAEDLQVLEPVVAAVAVDVVELERQRPPAPLRDPARLTMAREQPSVDEAVLDVGAPPGARQ
jgi:hypothetical protein